MESEYLEKMHLPLSIAPGSRILIAGAGGGYDFLCGLPIALFLQNLGHEILFANYSFSRLNEIEDAEWVNESILSVKPNSKMKNNGYFPEGKLSRWFKSEQNKDVPIFCFSNLGVKSLTRVYDFLFQRHSISHLILIDGGVDGIFRGDEFDLGTPSMDSISIIGASLSRIPNKIYSITAFGSEGLKGEISHAQVLNRISDLIKIDKMLGVTSLLKSSQIGETFIKAVKFIYQNSQRDHESNIVSSLIKSMIGEFGDTAVNSKTQERKIWISPLTSLFWFFDLCAVAEMKIFHKDVLETDSVEEVNKILETIRKDKQFSKRDQIPI